MNELRTLAAAVVVLVPLVSGCAGRTAPFDTLDKAQITMLRLGQAPAPVAAAPAAQPGFPTIPGFPPELTALGQQAMTGLQQVLPPGILPPGLFPGQAPVAQPQQALPQFKGFTIIAQPTTVSEDSVRDEILDVFGSEDNFSNQRGNCFSPGMGISIARNNAPAIELLVSLSCNQAMGDGFKWPYPSNGFTTETHARLQKLYEKLWGPVPPGA